MTTPEPAPAYLDPLHNELDRLRKWQHDVCDQFGYTPEESADALAWIPEFREKANAEAWGRAAAEVERKQVERALEQAEARVDQLTDELALTRDTLRLRSDAVNQVGATNDTLRAQIAEISRIVGMLATEVELECDPDDDEICHGHDLTDDGKCALLSDLKRVQSIIRGDAK